ncbi:hypothetical protein [Blastococcus atacamensis]|uniref:hypothetical protein n=1 Tax=Blastococcus atacamensis TaxID=2070508 RepID=UPI0012FFD53C|nr:hypothetical protein [Blastococcus atacamensis]
MPRPRWIVAALLALGLGVAFLAGISPQRPDLHEAADLRLFNAGNIVSDGVFYDPTTMTAQAIQDFLVVKGASCSGDRCLKTFRQDTWTRPADAFCAAYQGAGGESAAAIIHKVGLACGINPRALMVILQKEQGLIGSRGPSAYAIERAMGYACPDASVCDSRYFGLYNQLYSAAHRFKEYRANPAKFNYRAGMTNSINYAPMTAEYDNIGGTRCGKASVYIQNQATAGLYNYTPYVPNQAALDAGYGTANDCSTYGNRNFFLYFTDWFGSTQSSGGAAVLDKNSELAFAGVQLAAPLEDATCTLPYDGCSRAYAGGTIFWHAHTGAHVVRGAILERYLALGGPAGALGYPVGDDAAAPFGTGYYTYFQGGAIYWSAATGAHEVRGAILDAWRQAGAQAGVLGYPVGGDEAVPGGYRTRFTGGTTYWSAGTGARTIRGALLDKFERSGGPAALGYPVINDGATSTGDGAYVDLTGGSIYWTSATGARVVRGDILATYRALGAQAGPMGYPTGDDMAVPGGYKTDFRGGALYWSAATGTKGVRGALQAKYEALGGPAALGFPLAHDGATTTGGGATVRLQGGDLFWSPATGAHVVRGAILATYRSLGIQAGPMGFPTGDDMAVPGGYKTDFQGGALYWSAATGTKGVRGALQAKYEALGGPAALGFPLAHDGATTTGGGATVRLQGGDLFWSPATGAHVVRGAILATYRSLGIQAGPMGFPTGDDMAVPGGYKTDFQGGALYWSAATGTKGVRGALQAKYEALGGPAALGFPLAHDGATTTGGGAVVRLQGGEIYWSPGTGAHVVRGATLARWKQLGGHAGSLGFPVGDPTAVAGGQRTDFQRGYLLEASDGTVQVGAAG